MIRVLASPSDADLEVNPYIPLLHGALKRTGRVSITNWTARRAAQQRWDVVHLNWPESTVSMSGGRTVARTLAFLGLVAWARLRGAKIVWTAHDLRPHDAAGSRRGEQFYRAFTQLVDVTIVMSEQSGIEVKELYPALRRVPTVLVPQGHYRSVYLVPENTSKGQCRESLDLPASSRVLASIGQIRPYKNLPALIRHFSAVRGAEDRLLIAGNPNSVELDQELRQLAADHHNVIYRPGNVPMADLYRYVQASDAVILPYTAILNSGSAMMALSLDRPVVVPAVGSLKMLRDDLGPEWVRTYEGPLTDEVVRAALEADPPSGRPDLQRYDWDRIAASVMDGYAQPKPKRGRRSTRRTPPD